MNNSIKPDRRIFIFFYFCVLVALVWYGKVFNPAVTLQMCLNNPEKYDGTLIEVGDEARIVDISDAWFTIEQMGKIVRVVGSHKELRPHEYISLQGIFHREGWIGLTKVYVAVMRRYKILISIVPVIIILILFIRSFRFDGRRCHFTER
jgi:hypothetical protein